MSLTSDQCRAARALLRWSQDDAERQSGVSKKAIATFELGERLLHDQNQQALRRAFEDHGVELIPENGGGAGVRLAKRAAAVCTRFVEVPELDQITFRFSYLNNHRRVGTIARDELRRIGLTQDALSVWNKPRFQDAVLKRAAEMVDRNELDGKIARIRLNDIRGFD